MRATLSRAELNLDIPPLDVAEIMQPAPESLHDWGPSREIVDQHPNNRREQWLLGMDAAGP